MTAKLTKFMPSNNKIFKLILETSIIEVEVDKIAFEVLYIKKRQPFELSFYIELRTLLFSFTCRIVDTECTAFTEFLFYIGYETHSYFFMNFQ